MLGEEELPEDLIHGLLVRKRLLVIVDAFSEREPATQRYIEQIFATSAMFNAVVITSRSEPRLGAIERILLYPLLLDQKRVVPFIVDYVSRLPNADPLQGGRKLLKLGDRILELAEQGGEATPVTPLLVTMFVDGAINRAQSSASLDSLPQAVPEIFIDYLKRVYRAPSTITHQSAEGEFIGAASVLARASLGNRLVPSDFSPDEAIAALVTTELGDRAKALLDELINGGVIERRTFGNIAILRFGLDPVAEFLTAIHFVDGLRQLQASEIESRVNALMETDGYPDACDGYLKAFATCYRVYRRAFRLPETTFPWEVCEQSGHFTALQKSGTVDGLAREAPAGN
jgi:hypothetical protein